MKDPFSRLVLGVALALMIGWILIIGRSVILPVVASVIVAYVVLGLSELIGRIPGLRQLPVGVRYLVAIVAIGFVLVEMFSLLVTNIGSVVALAPQYQDRILALIQTLASHLGIEGEQSWRTLRQDILVYVNLQRLIGLTLGSAVAIAVSFLVVAIYTGFLLLEKNAFAAKIARISDEPAKVAQIQQVIHDVNSRIGTYLVMKTLINLVLAVGSYFIMLYFGIEFAGFWAVLIGLFNYIPYLGGWIGVGVPTLVAIAQFGAFWPVAVFVMAMTAIQVLLGNFVEPWLMGNSLNLSPFVILVSLVAWSSLWGIAGAILSVPIMAVLVILFSEFGGTRPLAILLSRDGDIGPARSRPE
ncbi:MAG: AI-2E family transporter [Amaricoccus sp.]|uniref:AI-2E family transporter n=1 Tax=Amaricoccus sp. TaxID=1872485 RepID=UPI003316395C